MFEVLFVCEGNVCRSPFAERLLIHRLAARGASDRFAVSSAGVRAVVDGTMHPLSEAGLVDRGGNAEGFGSTQLTSAIVQRAGVVLTATRDLRSRVLQEAPEALRRSFTMVEFAALAAGAPPGMTPGELVAGCEAQRSRLAGQDTDVEDPIRRDQEVFDRVADQLDRVVTAIADALARTR